MRSVPVDSPPETLRRCCSSALRLRRRLAGVPFKTSTGTQSSTIEMLERCSTQALKSGESIREDAAGMSNELV